MNRSRLRVAIIGVEHCHIRGNIRLLQARDDVEVVAVWGRDTVRAEETAQLFGLKARTAIEEVPAADLALVTTDTADHVYALNALQGRVDAVHLDKPLGLDAADAERVAALAEPYGDKFGLGFFTRHNAQVIDLVRRVRGGEIGRLRRMSLTFGHAGRLEGWLDDWPAFEDPARMGYGAFGELAAHTLDVATLMLGPLMPLACTKQWDPHQRRLDVGGAALAEGGDGCLVQLFTSSVMKGPRFEIRCDGETGTLWLRGKELGIYGPDETPIVLKTGDWCAASDSPAAMINRCLGLPHAPLATAHEGVLVNRLLDAFEALAQTSRTPG